MIKDNLSHLLDNLLNTELHKRMSALKTLKDVDCPEALAGLLIATSDPAADIRFKALLFLINHPYIDNRQILAEVMINALQDENDTVLKTALSGISRLQPIEALTPMENLLKSNHQIDLVKHILYAWSKYTNSDIIKPLLNFYYYTNVVDYKVQTLKILCESWLEYEQVINMVIATLADPKNPLELRIIASNSISQINETQTIGLLCDIASDHAEPSALRAAVMTSLGWKNDKKSVSVLVQALTDSDAEIRIAAVCSLGQINDQSTIKNILPLLTDPEWKIREMTLWTIENLKYEKIDTIAENMIDDPSPEVQIAAINIIGRSCKPEFAKCILEKLKSKDLFVKKAAAKSITRFNESSVTVELRELLETDGVLDETTYEIIMNLIGNKNWINTLKSLMNNPTENIRLAAISTISTIDSVEIIPILIESLQDKSKQICYFSILTLSKFRNKEIENIFIKIMYSEGYTQHIRTFAAQYLLKSKNEKFRKEAARFFEIC